MVLISALFDKEIPEDLSEFNGFLFNKSISNIDKQYTKYSSSMDKYVFNLSEEHLFYLFFYTIPKQKTPFIPYFEQKNKSKDELFDEIKRFYKISDKDFEKQKQVYDLILKKHRKEYEVFFGLRKSDKIVKEAKKWF